jgi:UDP-N-acetylmuramoyl-tripeptide--D-alanyl-D-alanine ligase
MMMNLTRAQTLLRTLVPGTMLVGNGDAEVMRVHTDTRSLRPGDLYVALRGAHFDGHEFIGRAKIAGAAGAIAERGLMEAGLPGIIVPDSQAALQALATAWRSTLSLPVIAVTGSNGKTTVTQMIAAILREWLGDAAWATAGNFNNHIGVPLTVLGLRQNKELMHRAAVIELGMNHPGEIAELARIAQPTVALVNNAQREHQEFMKSVGAVARENGAVLQALPADGMAVFPADDEFTPVWQHLAEPRITLTFSLDQAADLTAQAEWLDDHWSVRAHTPAGAFSLTLQVAGRHNVKNALAAAACTLAAGCPLSAVQSGLNAFAPVTGRSQVRRFRWRGRDLTLVDDSYNANPDSVRAAIDMLAGLPGPRWLLLGDMGEVGDQGPAFHAEVGRYARERGIEHLWAAGALAIYVALAYGKGARHGPTAAALVSMLDVAPQEAVSILVKGSRFMRMEQLVVALFSQSSQTSQSSPSLLSPSSSTPDEGRHAH